MKTLMFLATAVALLSTSFNSAHATRPILTARCFPLNPAAHTRDMGVMHVLDLVVETPMNASMKVQFVHHFPNRTYQLSQRRYNKFNGYFSDPKTFRVGFDYNDTWMHLDLSRVYPSRALGYAYRGSLALDEDFGYEVECVVRK